MSGMAGGREARALESAAFHCGAFPDVPSVGAAELMALRAGDDDEAVVVDVRTGAERRVARVPRSLSRRDFEARLRADAAAFAERDVVVVCTVGRRSGAYASKLAARGARCRRVLNSHGVVAYSHHAAAHGDGPHALVDDAGRPARRIHVFARPWDFASDRFEAVKFGPLGAAMAMLPGRDS